MSASHYFLIIHGTKGSPESNWFPWLKQELQNHGMVIVPKFPTPDWQNLDAWLSVAKQALAGCEPQKTIVIGHSIGATTALRMAGESYTTVQGGLCRLSFHA